MHFHSAFASVVALVLFGANTSAAPVAAEVCSAIDNRFPVVTFQSWITDCGDKGGHTMGMSLVYPSLTDICLPLNSNIRGLDLLEVTEGCRSMFLSNDSKDSFSDECQHSYGLSQPCLRRLPLRRHD